MTSEEERGRSGGDPPGAEEEAGGGDEPRDGAPQWRSQNLEVGYSYFLNESTVIILP